MSEPLPAVMVAALETTAARRGSLGHPATYFPEIGSTNDEAARLAEQGAPEGTMVIASAQTSGRGRLGRSWHSPAGAGLYVSLVIRSPDTVPFLTLAGGVAVAHGIREATGLAVQIKWPNDIVVSDSVRPSKFRKLAGILAEASSSATGIVHVVLGFGINVRTVAYPREIAARATSLEFELGREVNAGAVLAETLAALHTQMERLRTGVTDTLLADWRALAPSSRGGLVEFDTPTGRAEGAAAGIDDSGALLVRVGSSVERVRAGEVVWK